MRNLYKDQRGVTLIELLVVLVIIGIITGGITAGIRQVLTVNTRASNHMIAVRQVQQAGKEVSKDALQAQSINATGSQGFPLTLMWNEWGTNQTNIVIYELVDMPSGLKQLHRSHTINGTAQPTAPPVVAEYIDPDQTSCSWNNVTLSFTVTATIGIGSYGAIETRIYEIEPRPD
jgi:prepilin-type N-terminal cleavage/methylation domain-containing protein